eukprot:1138763-Pelagomonas_calceolata.AAC.8
MVKIVQAITLVLVQFCTRSSRSIIRLCVNDEIDDRKSAPNPECFKSSGLQKCWREQGVLRVAIALTQVRAL